MNLGEGREVIRVISWPSGPRLSTPLFNMHTDAIVGERRDACTGVPCICVSSSPPPASPFLPGAPFTENTFPIDVFYSSTHERARRRAEFIIIHLI